MDSTPLYIFDLDGTIALIDHRRYILSDERLTTEERWNAFYDACPFDEPNQPIISLLKTIIQSRCEIWIWTARNDGRWSETYDWLEDHDIFLGEGFYDHDERPIKLKMRPVNDFTPDHDLKERWLFSMNEVDRRRLVAVFEDLRDNVDMFRRNGVCCIQVADGSIVELREPTEEEIVANHYRRSEGHAVYVSPNRYPSIGKPASTEHQRAVAENIAKHHRMKISPHQVRWIPLS